MAPEIAPQIAPNCFSYPHLSFPEFLVMGEDVKSEHVGVDIAVEYRTMRATHFLLWLFFPWFNRLDRLIVLVIILIVFGIVILTPF